MANRRTLIITAFVFFLILAGITFLTLRDTSLDQIRRADTIHIGYAVEAPFAFLAPDNTITGESPEVARAVVSRLGIQHIEWIQTTFDNLIPELEAGRFDVIAAGMFITKSRAERVAFSQPTFHVNQGLLVRTGNPLRLTSYTQAAQVPNVRIAVLAGSVEELLLQRVGIAKNQLIATPNIVTGQTAVQSNLADGLALSLPTLRWIMNHERLANLEIAEPFSQPDPALTAHLGYGAFAFRLKDHQLRIAWDTAMRPLIGSPEHLQIIEPFGFSAADLPGNITTEEVIAQ